MEVVLGSKHLAPLPLHTCYSNTVSNFCHGSTFAFFHKGPNSLVISVSSATHMGFCGRIYYQFCILNDVVTNRIAVVINVMLTNIIFHCASADHPGIMFVLLLLTT